MAKLEQLSAEQIDQYSNDEFRAQIRTELSGKYTEDETIHVTDPEGQVWDVFQGALPGQAVEVTGPSAEEIQAREAQERKDAEHIQYLEQEIRPIVMKRLKLEAKHEVKAEMKALTDEIVTLKRTHSAELDKLYRENARLSRLVPMGELRMQPGSQPSAEAINAGALK